MKFLLVMHVLVSMVYENNGNVTYVPIAYNAGTYISEKECEKIGYSYSIDHELVGNKALFQCIKIKKINKG